MCGGDGGGRRFAQLGNLRVDVNVSTRRMSDGLQSDRCEVRARAMSSLLPRNGVRLNRLADDVEVEWNPHQVKNLNSFERVRKAVEYEAHRQQGTRPPIPIHIHARRRRASRVSLVRPFVFAERDEFGLGRAQRC